MEIEIDSLSRNRSACLTSISALAARIVTIGASFVIIPMAKDYLSLGHYAVLSVLADLWESFLCGIGLGNHALTSEIRVNNFLPQLIIYSSVFGLTLMAIAIIMPVRSGHRSNHIVQIVLLYAMSTPMVWSPLFLMKRYIARRAQGDWLPLRVLSLETQR